MPEVLYRKYRPSSFDEVIGQEQVVTVLKNTLEKGTIGHAYLFHGGRGTGKTSVARILAKALGTDPTDVYEIDAASNRGIDDIRELREGVRTMPFRSRYKVYIIDEAHMLTKEAWNALLKTLEEPPEHAIFVMATTELHKVPETILSRAEVHSFKEPTLVILEGVIKATAAQEKIKIADDAASLIATLGDGSFRNTLGVLQKVISSADKESISLEDVERVYGLPDKEAVRLFLSALLQKNAAAALEIFQKVRGNTIDPKLFLLSVIERARTALLAKISKVQDEFAADVTSKTLLSLLSAYERLRLSPIPELAIEIALAEL